MLFHRGRRQNDFPISPLQFKGNAALIGKAGKCLPFKLKIARNNSLGQISCNIDYLPCIKIPKYIFHLYINRKLMVGSELELGTCWNGVPCPLLCKLRNISIQERTMTKPSMHPQFIQWPLCIAQEDHLKNSIVILFNQIFSKSI